MIVLRYFPICFPKDHSNGDDVMNDEKMYFNHLKRVMRLSFILRKDKKVCTKWVTNYNNNKRSRISMFIPHLIQSGFNVKGFYSIEDNSVCNYFI